MKEYIERLEAAKKVGPDWPAQTRLDLAMACAYMIQRHQYQELFAGKKIPAEIPNMQSILEIGGMPAEELEALRPTIIKSIDTTMIPFMRKEQEEWDKNAVTQGEGGQLVMKNPNIKKPSLLRWLGYLFW